MKMSAFDGIVRELGEGSTRRGFFSYLGGAVAAGAGLTLAIGEHAEAEGTNRGKARDRGEVKAQGRGKKITVCYQDQTRQVKKKGWQQKFPGATLGRCPAPAEPVACTSWILSGGPDPTTRIQVDDDLTVAVNGTILLEDADSKASSLTPLNFTAKVGDELGILAYDAIPSCRSLSSLWLHCATTGQKRKIFAGNSDGCASGRTAGRFVREFFIISL